MKPIRNSAAITMSTVALALPELKYQQRCPPRARSTGIWTLALTGSDWPGFSQTSLGVTIGLFKPLETSTLRV